METKGALDYLRMLKPQAIFTTVAIVCHRYERLAVLQSVFAIILLWAVILAGHCLMTGLYFEPWVIVCFFKFILCALNEATINYIYM